MSKYRQHLPQLSRLFLTDGGLETYLIFHMGMDLPRFASIDLMRRPGGPDMIRDYYMPFVRIAADVGAGFILDTPTWRASPDWAEPIGFSNLSELADANQRGLALMEEMRRAIESDTQPVVVSAIVGPRGDGYDPGRPMSADEAEAYHSWQMAIFADSTADLVSAMTMNNIAEAIGIARAAKAFGLPIAISFTVETDGRLPTGDTLESAITAVDEATAGTPAYYMINCAHPSHFADTLVADAAWVKRLKGVRANASRRSHAELDCACDLDDGNPGELGAEMAELRRRLPHITVLGGCCGTDHRHIAAIGSEVGGAQRAA